MRNWFKFLGTALLAVAVALTALPLTLDAAETPAKTLFGNKKLPAAMAAHSFGFYSKGCFSGGVAIATDGPTWQAMRLSRNRRWGHPTMIRLIEKLSREAKADGWPGLLIGDISQPRGGPMLTGHASHQIGLDADIWLNPMPDHKMSYAERENMSAVSMIKKGKLTVDDRLWTPAHAALIRRAAMYPEVERIFVHPGIKKKLCDTAKGERSWLRKVRPFWGHDYHFHIRIGCQPGSQGCKEQDKVPAGDGCDKLDWWFTDEPWRPATGPEKPKARDVMTMKSLPKACRAVLDAPNPASEAAVTLGVDGSMVASAQPAPAEPAAEPQVDTSAAPIAANAYVDTPETGAPLPRPRPEN